MVSISQLPDRIGTVFMVSGHGNHDRRPFFCSKTGFKFVFPGYLFT